MDGWRSLATVVMQFVFSRNAHDFLHGMTAYIGMFIQKRCLPSLATLNMMNLMEPNGSRRKHPIALGQRRLQLAVCPVHYLAWPGRVHQGWDEEPEARDDPSTRRDQASAIGTIGHRHHEFHFQCDLAIKKTMKINKEHSNVGSVDVSSPGLSLYNVFLPACWSISFVHYLFCIAWPP